MTKKINQNSWTMRMTFFCRTLTQLADITNASISLPDNCPAISTNAPKPVPCCWLLSMKSLSISSRHRLCSESCIIWLPPISWAITGSITHERSAVVMIFWTRACPPARVDKLSSQTNPFLGPAKTLTSRALTRCMLYEWAQVMSWAGASNEYQWARDLQKGWIQQGWDGRGGKQVAAYEYL